MNLENGQSSAPVYSVVLQPWVELPPNTFRLRVWIDSEYCVYAADLPGCASQGETLDECLTQIVDAFRGCAECYLLDGGRIPFKHGGDRPPFHEERFLTVTL